MDELHLSVPLTGSSQVLGELLAYTLAHFVCEEALLEAVGYRFTRLHKRVHEIFTGRVSDYALRFTAGEDIAEELTGACLMCKTGLAPISGLFG